MAASCSLFAPGVRLMRSLRIPVNMSLLGLFLLVPLALLMVSTFRASQASTGLAGPGRTGGQAEGRTVHEQLVFGCGIHVTTAQPVVQPVAA